MKPTAPTANSDAENVRATERERTRALVSGEMEIARQLHADDYELVTPLGVVLSKEQYLGAVAAGDLHYLVWDVESPIKVRLYSEVAAIRYQADIEIVVQGQAYPRARVWHTDVYEKRAGRWQAVWSQATAIA
jgi:hypothetical protein